MNELLESYSRLMTILQKMSKSQLEDLGILQEQLSLARQETETLKTQLMIQEKQTRHLVEYNAYLESKQKKANLRLLSGIGLGLGAGMFMTSLALQNDNPIMRDVFKYGGIAFGVTGAAGLIVLSIPFK